MACWSSGNAFVFGAGGRRFKSRAGQIERSVATGSPSLRHFSERNCFARAQWRGDGPRHLVTRFSMLLQVQRWALRKIVRNFRKLRNLRCALCLFFRSCAICVELYACFFSACAICVALYAFFFQRLRNLRLRIGKSNICCALIVSFFPRCAITK